MHVPWEQFLQRYSALARTLAIRLSGRRQDADDIVQEAAMALLSALKRDYHLESVEHARNYFLRAVHNLALKRRRSPVVSDGLDQQPGPPALNGVERLVLAERRRQLDAAVAALPEFQRELVTRRFVQRQTLQQVSTELGVPVSTLHSREKALLAALRRRLGPLAEDGS